MIQKPIFLMCLLAGWVFNPIFCQTKGSPYKMHALLDLPIVGVSGLGLAGTRYYERQIEPLSSVQIALLNTSDLNSFDRSATQRWSPTFSTVSDVGMFTAILSPSLLFFSPEIPRTEWGSVLVISAETIFLTDFLTNLTKSTTLRPRPYLYNPDPAIPTDLLESRDHRFSFFSGSTSAAAAMSFATASMFADYHPKSKAKPYVWAAAAILPAVVAYSRYEAGMHFPTDVIVGYVVGTGVGLLIPYLHRKAKNWFR